MEKCDNWIHVEKSENGTPLDMLRTESLRDDPVPRVPTPFPMELKSQNTINDSLAINLPPFPECSTDRSRADPVTPPPSPIPMLEEEEGPPPLDVIANMLTIQSISADVKDQILKTCTNVTSVTLVTLIRDLLIALARSNKSLTDKQRIIAIIVKALRPWQSKWVDQECDSLVEMLYNLNPKEFQDTQSHCCFLFKT